MVSDEDVVLFSGLFQQHTGDVVEPVFQVIDEDVVLHRSS